MKIIFTPGPQRTLKLLTIRCLKNSRQASQREKLM